MKLSIRRLTDIRSRFSRLVDAPFIPKGSVFAKGVVAHQCLWNFMRKLSFNIKTLFLSSSMVYNIVKRFREAGEITVRKGQARKPLLNVPNL